MKIENLSFTTTDWTRIEPVEYPGLRGSAYWRTVESGNIRVRHVEYTQGYVADHWCERGHVLMVLEGEVVIELRHGDPLHLSRGASWVVGEGSTAHRLASPTGSVLFIVD